MCLGNETRLNVASWYCGQSTARSHRGKRMSECKTVLPMKGVFMQSIKYMHTYIHTYIHACM